MRDDHVDQRPVPATGNADGERRRLFDGPPGIPLDAFWALVDPDRETARER